MQMRVSEHGFLVGWACVFDQPQSTSSAGLLFVIRVWNRDQMIPTLLRIVARLYELAYSLR